MIHVLLVVIFCRGMEWEKCVRKVRVQVVDVLKQILGNEERVEWNTCDAIGYTGWSTQV